MDESLVEVLALTPEFPLTLGQVVQKYGNPDAFLAWLEASEDPNWTYNVRIHYPRMGFAAYVHTRPPKGSSPFTIASDMLVSEVDYFPAGSTSDLFAKGQTYLSLGPWSSAAERYLQEWKGFGTVEVAPYGFR